MILNYNRRGFIKTAAIAGASLVIPGSVSAVIRAAELRVGIIGLDTSHSPAFAKLLNDSNKAADLAGYKVVAAYPKGSEDIEGSVKRIPGYTKEIEAMGIRITSSVEELVESVDVVLLNTNDGRLHLKQALPVFKAGKRLFIDKPVAAHLPDVLAIYAAAQHYNVPVFSSSSLRFFDNASDLKSGKIGNVIGADTYSPNKIEKTHSYFYWYGIHGLEMLYAVMGTGAKSVKVSSNNNTDIVVGTWNDNRLGTFRGINNDNQNYGGVAFGEKGALTIVPPQGYRNLLVEVVKFFKTGISPVKPEETIELFAFMAAAEESRKQGGKEISIQSVLDRARKGMPTN